jgi:hypothetical protein
MLNTKRRSLEVEFSFQQRQNTKVQQGPTSKASVTTPRFSFKGAGCDHHSGHDREQRLIGCSNLLQFSLPERWSVRVMHLRSPARCKARAQEPSLILVWAMQSFNQKLKVVLRSKLAGPTQGGSSFGATGSAQSWRRDPGKASDLRRFYYTAQLLLRSTQSNHQRKKKQSERKEEKKSFPPVRSQPA